jgi:hypothetical protein
VGAGIRVAVGATVWVGRAACAVGAAGMLVRTGVKVGLSVFTADGLDVTEPCCAPPQAATSTSSTANPAPDQLRRRIVWVPPLPECSYLASR